MKKFTRFLYIAFFAVTFSLLATGAGWAAPKDGADQAKETIAALTPEQVAAVSPKTIAGLNPEVLNAVSPEVVSALSPEQVAAVPVETISQLDANTIGGLSQEATSALTTKQVEAIPTETIAALPAKEIAEFKGGDLTSKQVQAIPAETIAKLPAKEIAEFQGKDLSSQQVKALPVETIAALPASETAPTEVKGAPAEKAPAIVNPDALVDNLCLPQAAVSEREKAEDQVLQQIVNNPETTGETQKSDKGTAAGAQINSQAVAATQLARITAGAQEFLRISGGPGVASTAGEEAALTGGSSAKNMELMMHAVKLGVDGFQNTLPQGTQPGIADKIAEQMTVYHEKFQTYMSTAVKTYFESPAYANTTGPSGETPRTGPFPGPNGPGFDPGMLANTCLMASFNPNMTQDKVGEGFRMMADRYKPAGQDGKDNNIGTGREMPTNMTPEMAQMASFMMAQMPGNTPGASMIGTPGMMTEHGFVGMSPTMGMPGMPAQNGTMPGMTMTPEMTAQMAAMPAHNDPFAGTGAVGWTPNIAATTAAMDQQFTNFVQNQAIAQTAATLNVKAALDIGYRVQPPGAHTTSSDVGPAPGVEHIHFTIVNNNAHNDVDATSIVVHKDHSDGSNVVLYQEPAGHVEDIHGIT